MFPIAQLLCTNSLIKNMKTNKFVTDKERHLKIVRRLTKLLEDEFSIWKFKFGIDPILGLVPGLGDIIPSILACYLVFVALLHKIHPLKIAHMIFNILVD